MSRRRALVASALLLAGILALWHFAGPQGLRAMLESAAQAGPAGKAAFVGLFVLATLAFVPGTPLTLAAGALWGLKTALPLVLLGACLGATAAFLAGRGALRPWVEARLARHPRFQALDRALGRGGWRVVLLCRLTPVLPFSLLNYALSLSRIRLRHFVWATALGILPGGLLITYVGTLAGSLAGLGGARERTPLEWGFFGLGLAATAGLTVYLARMARRAMGAVRGGVKPRRRRSSKKKV